MKSGISVSSVEKNKDVFTVVTDNNEKFKSKTILIAAGSHYRKLNIPGEKEFEGKGVSYCSICDAPLFKNKAVAVIGGGNSALGAVIDLFSYASKIYLIIRSDSFRGDIILQEKIKSASWRTKVEIITMAVVQEIMGDNFVNGLKYLDRKTNKINEIKLGGVFVSIGYEPNSGLVKDLVELNKYKQIIVDHKTQKTTQEGIWAAGDITDVLYKQNNIAIGDGIKAVLNIYDFITDLY
ncbi:MAG TPA: pyridine nucleotide-disulfide oxidoreductase [Candidatus Wolfebacteria bacterium]|nr:pyridine nucleotide-disulfide oxidoreductase [Candidatus Wolfebacteria bacterium]